MAYTIPFEAKTLEYPIFHNLILQIHPQTIDENVNHKPNDVAYVFGLHL
jgi:hypothetical protein